MINLSFVKSHLSIVQFPDISLPNFTVITGENGAGKTHLLQAISQGSIKVDVAAGQSLGSRSIKLFDWSNMVPQDSGYFASDSFQNERSNLWANYANSRNYNDWIEPIRHFLRKYSMDQRYIIEPYEVLNISDEELAKFIADRDIASFRIELSAIINDYENKVLGNFDQNSRDQIYAISKFFKKTSIDSGGKRRFIPGRPPLGANRPISAIFRSNIRGLSRCKAAK